MMTVTRASPDEWPWIEKLRQIYFARWKQPVQHRDGNTRWMVALNEKREVCGVYSYVDAEEYGQRWIQDFYIGPGYEGKLAGQAIWLDIRETHKRTGMAVVCMVHPQNFRQLRFMHRRGWRPVAVTMVLP